jgi:pimeloyl-ACP methyl ester carboxylesterase/DNA-binding CsgD family transcriptional regulator
LAYQVFGDGPVDLVFVPGFISHIEYAWTEPMLARFLRRLSAFVRVVAFDKRGMGQSDRNPNDATPTMQERLEDLTRVLDAAGSTSAVVLAWSEGGPMALTFAAEQPERTEALALFGTAARFTSTEDYPAGVPREILEVFVDTVGSEWGTGVAFDLYAPSLSDDDRARTWWASYQRYSATPGAVVATLTAQLDVDARQCLPLVRAPSLVVHRKRDMVIPVECGRYLAQHLESSTYLEQDADDHMFWVGSQDETLAALRRLVDRTPSGTGVAKHRPRRPRSGWESLTDAELDIVELISQGLTNIEIANAMTVSPRTVQTHVTHVLGKLGLRRRAEIAAHASGRRG